MENQLTVPRVIEFIAADLDSLREFWRKRKDRKLQDLQTFIGKLDSQIDFWNRLQILNSDPNKSKENCLKCALKHNEENRRKKV